MLGGDLRHPSLKYICKHAYTPFKVTSFRSCSMIQPCMEACELNAHLRLLHMQHVQQKYAGLEYRLLQALPNHSNLYLLNVWGGSVS